MLVTGGCGFIGSNLASELSRNGHNVTIIDNLAGPRDDYKSFLQNNPGVEFIEGCYAGDEVIEMIKSKKFDYVFHNAAIPRVSYSVENPYETTEVNVSRTSKLLEACSGNIKRFVFASSSSVYGGADTMPTPNTHQKSPKSPYAWQKSCIEDLIKIFVDLYDDDIVCLRYFNVFGPGQFGGSAYSTAVSAWCHAIKNGLPLRSDGTGDQSRDMCYVDNVVQANIKAALRKEKFKGECYNVACGDRTSNNEILEFLKNRFPSVTIKNAPPRPGDVMHTQADVSSSRGDFNYNPEVKFWEGLERTLEWWGLRE